MRTDMEFAKDMFSCCGEDYGFNFYREDLVKYFQQVNYELLKKHENKPHYYISEDELVPRK